MKDETYSPRRRRHPPSITGALVIIAVGVLLLVTQLNPHMNAVAVIMKYWPVAIILVGLGKVWEAFWYRNRDDASGVQRQPQSAMPYVVLLIVALILVGMFHEGRVQASIHDSHSVDVGAAKDVHAKLDIATGKLNIAGGADRLLNADFNYLPSDGKPGGGLRDQGWPRQYQRHAEQRQPHPDDQLAQFVGSAFFG